MTKLSKITWILFLSACALYSLTGCGGGGGGGSGSGSGSTVTLLTTPAVTTAALELGTPVRTGNIVTLPLTLTNTNGYPISGIEADIGFDSKAFALIMNGSTPASATPGEATVLAGKTIYQSKSPTQSSVMHLAIIDLGGKKSISSGVVAKISFEVTPNAPTGNYTFTLVTNATDANGVATTVPVTNPTVNFTL